MAKQGRARQLSRTLTASEAAALIGVSVATIRGWADNGSLPSHRTVGGHRRFDIAELRIWMHARGATMPAPVAGVARATKDVPACPSLARELNARTEAILGSVRGGYSDDVPTLAPRPSDPAIRRSATRFLRIITAALETGSITKSVGRAELAGLRDGTQPDALGNSLTHLMRVAMAIAVEAQHALDEGLIDEPLAIPAVLAVTEHVVAADLRGLQQARVTRAPTTRAPRTKARDAQAN
jgi:excisionase family DNA binding protein